MLGACVSGFITIPRSCKSRAHAIPYRDNARSVRQLLHNLDLSTGDSTARILYLRIFFLRTGLRYLMLTASPVSISIALNTSLYFPLPTFRMIWYLSGDLECVKRLPPHLLPIDVESIVIRIPFGHLANHIRIDTRNAH